MNPTLSTLGLSTALVTTGILFGTSSLPQSPPPCEVLTRGVSRVAVRDNFPGLAPPAELDLAYVYDASSNAGVPDAAPATPISKPTRGKSGVHRRSLAQLPQVSTTLRVALVAQRELLRQQPRGRRYKIGGRQLRAADFIKVIDQLLEGGGDAPLPEVLTVACRGEVHFTAYYTPELKASRVRTARFRYPLLQAPEPGDRTNLPTRASIESDPEVASRFDALAWLEHPLDVHLIQLQGSGYVVFPDGSRQYLAYGCGNGQPYRSLLTAIREKRPETRAMSFKEIRAYMAEDLESRGSLTWLNPSYVFFRESDTTPQGSAGVPLVPMISVAADPDHYPPGAVLLAEVPRPGHSGLTETRILLVQDKGSGIKGRDRIDLYAGVGPEALDLARLISDSGEVYVLAPALPRA